MVDVDEENETDEESDIIMMKSIARYMVNGVKDNKKDVPPKTSMKNTEIVKNKTPQRMPVSKKIKVEEKSDEKKSLKRKFVQSSNFETDDKEDVHNIVFTIRRKVCGKVLL